MPKGTNYKFNLDTVEGAKTRTDTTKTGWDSLLKIQDELIKAYSQACAFSLIARRVCFNSSVTNVSGIGTYPSPALPTKQCGFMLGSNQETPPLFINASGSRCDSMLFIPTMIGLMHHPLARINELASPGDKIVLSVGQNGFTKIITPPISIAPMDESNDLGSGSVYGGTAINGEKTTVTSLAYTYPNASSSTGSVTPFIVQEPNIKNRGLINQYNMVVNSLFSAQNSLITITNLLCWSENFLGTGGTSNWIGSVRTNLLNFSQTFLATGGTQNNWALSKIQNFLCYSQSLEETSGGINQWITQAASNLLTRSNTLTVDTPSLYDNWWIDSVSMNSLCWSETFATTGGANNWSYSSVGDKNLLPYSENMGSNYIPGNVVPVWHTPASQNLITSGSMTASNSWTFMVPAYTSGFQSPAATNNQSILGGGAAWTIYNADIAITNYIGWTDFAGLASGGIISGSFGTYTYVSEPNPLGATSSILKIVNHTTATAGQNAILINAGAAGSPITSGIKFSSLNSGTFSFWVKVTSGTPSAGNWYAGDKSNVYSNVTFGTAPIIANGWQRGFVRVPIGGSLTDSIFQIECRLASVQWRVWGAQVEKAITMTAANCNTYPFVEVASPPADPLGYSSGTSSVTVPNTNADESVAPPTSTQVGGVIATTVTATRIVKASATTLIKTFLTTQAVGGTGLAVSAMHCWTFYVKPAFTTTPSILYTTNGGTNWTNLYASTSVGWTKYSINFTTPASGNVVLGFKLPDAACDLYIWGFKIEKGKYPVGGTSFPFQESQLTPTSTIFSPAITAYNVTNLPQHINRNIFSDSTNVGTTRTLFACGKTVFKYNTVLPATANYVFSMYERLVVQSYAGYPTADNLATFIEYCADFNDLGTDTWASLPAVTSDNQSATNPEGFDSSSSFNFHAATFSGISGKYFAIRINTSGATDIYGGVMVTVYQALYRTTSDTTEVDPILRAWTPINTTTGQGYSKSSTGETNPNLAGAVTAVVYASPQLVLCKSASQFSLGGQIPRIKWNKTITNSALSTYVFSFYARVNSGANPLFVVASMDNGVTYISHSISVNATTYTRYTISSNAAVIGVKMYINNTSTVGIYIYGCQLEIAASATTYLPTQIPSLATNMTITGVAINNPISVSQTCYKFNGASIVPIKNTISVGSSLQRTFSCWVQAVGATNSGIKISDGTTNTDITTITNTAWTRISLTSTAVQVPQISFLSAADTFFLWGAQLETGSIAGTYQATAAAAFQGSITRASSPLQITTTGKNAVIMNSRTFSANTVRKLLLELSTTFAQVQYTVDGGTNWVAAASASTAAVIGTSATPRFGLRFPNAVTSLVFNNIQAIAASSSLDTSITTTTLPITTGYTRTTGILDPIGTNSAASYTTSLADWVIYNSDTRTAATRVFSIYIKRLVGTGNISISTDHNQATPTYTVQAITGSWVRYSFSASLATCRIAIKIATSGDSIAVYGAQLENGATVTAYGLTTSSPIDSSCLLTSNSISDPEALTTAVSRITASGALANITNSQTFTSFNGTFSIYIKRVTGSGNINYTINGGSNWTAIGSITTSWARFQFPSSALTRVGLQISNNADAFDIWGAQLETGATATSLIKTTTTTLSNGLTISSGSVTSDPVIGTTSFNTFTASATSNQDIIQTVSGVVSAVQTISFYAKKTTLVGSFKIIYSNVLSEQAFTLTTSWARYSFVANTQGKVGIRLNTANDSVSVWGFQMEDLGVLHQYVPTTTASASTTVSSGVFGTAGVATPNWAVHTGTLNATTYPIGTYVEPCGTRNINVTSDRLVFKQEKVPTIFGCTYTYQIEAQVVSGSPFLYDVINVAAESATVSTETPTIVNVCYTRSPLSDTGVGNIQIGSTYQLTTGVNKQTYAITFTAYCDAVTLYWGVGYTTASVTASVNFGNPQFTIGKTSRLYSPTTSTDTNYPMARVARPSMYYTVPIYPSLMNGFQSASQMIRSIMYINSKNAYRFIQDSEDSAIPTTRQYVNFGMGTNCDWNVITPLWCGHTRNGGASPTSLTSATVRLSMFDIYGIVIPSDVLRSI